MEKLMRACEKSSREVRALLLVYTYKCGTSTVVKYKRFNVFRLQHFLCGLESKAVYDVVKPRYRQTIIYNYSLSF